MTNDLVPNSRAGDAFHYRWAARRCLRMIYPKSDILYMVIEGSGTNEQEMAGEYQIDVTEYSGTDENNLEKIAYYQLKHTTVRGNQPFQLSDLRNIIEGFSRRYSDHISNNIYDEIEVTFTIVTNRPFSDNFKQNIQKIANGNVAELRFQDTIKKYTNLANDDLKKFCALLELYDYEGDYNTQRSELHKEISHILAGSVDNSQIESIIGLVAEKVLPDYDNKITREDVYKCFNITFDNNFYPAPSEIKAIDNPIQREQYKILIERIISDASPVIIHAVGGVGKTVFAKILEKSLPADSLGIVYDCYGGGLYRNPSKLRHRYRDALVQIANELSSKGLCDPLLAQSSALDSDIIKAFIRRLEISIKSIRKVKDDALLVIIIDAADNAEMAAKEYNDLCFAQGLLGELLPEGCKLVALCRTERLKLLDPLDAIKKYELEQFSEEETLLHLRQYFADATNLDGKEFFRLSNNGNPRVQSVVIDTGHETVKEVLQSFGPSAITVDDQIELSLNSALLKLKNSLSRDYWCGIDNICQGLANLPPLIPLEVLACVSDVDVAMIKSFITDFDKPLWLSDNSVHFRDEPTESWFHKKFRATKEHIDHFILILTPFSKEYTYVAEALPGLFLQAGKYKELITLALSDDFLPENNPIDQRSVRIYRLQFAFKAALKEKNYFDATKLALRAGEEAAGNKRQLELLKKNTDIIAKLQGIQKVQELAYRRLISSSWDGSENLYSASLLSSVEDCKGEARGYLRSAINWLNIYFEERLKEREENQFHHNQLTHEDIAEIIYTHYNLFGISDAVHNVCNWTPPLTVFNVSKIFIRRLIDAGKIDEIISIPLKITRSLPLILAITYELSEVGHLPSVELLEQGLILLTNKRTRLELTNYSYYIDKTIENAIILFLESCAKKKFPKERILRVIRHYFQLKASRGISDSHNKNRPIFLRSTALRCVLIENYEPDLKELLNEKSGKEKKSEYEEEFRKFRETIGALLPWYILRARCLIDNLEDVLERIKETAQKSNIILSHSYERTTIHSEISCITIEILAHCQWLNEQYIENIYEWIFKSDRSVLIKDQLKALRISFHNDHLSGIRREIEDSTREIIFVLSEDPETKAQFYIDLARAVLHFSTQDAAVYFNYAVEAVSKFGDEVVQRWNTVAALGSRSAEYGCTSPEMAYRFIRCAEVVGENVAREKYWNRNEAIEICTRLSPSSALAALSRWRDRDVGWFNNQLSAMAEEIVRMGIMPTTVAWSLSSFIDYEELYSFAKVCIEKENSPEQRQKIFNHLIHYLRLSDTSVKTWEKIKEFAIQHSLNNNALDEVLHFYSENIINMEDEETRNNKPYKESSGDEKVNWDEIFYQLDLSLVTDIDEAFKRYNALLKFRDYREFWQQVYNRISENDAVKFLIQLLDSEAIGFYNIKDALIEVPSLWRRKVSLIHNWKVILKKVGSRYASHLASHGSLNYFINGIFSEKIDLLSIKEGITEGLASASDLVDADTFFGFVEIAEEFISPQQAVELLDYALARFEMHIDDDSADGLWSNWLEPPENIGVAFSGFIWTALGSPNSGIRWKAAHCVRLMADFNCQNEIDGLIEWMRRDQVAAFGSNKYPFYNLHARLYLLISLSRISIDNPEMLKKHHEIFYQHALDSMPHVLIQKFASNIVLNIEKAYPGIYKQNIIQSLKQTCISQFPYRVINYNDTKINSYLHEHGKVDTSLKFLHGYDFDSYWFKPLGDVFGVTEKQVEELATEIVVKEWSINIDGSYKSDPRMELWKYKRSEEEISHSHGSYPITDGYSFYLSYHSMFVVASKLLKNMPVTALRDYEEDEYLWEEWLKRHLLTRNDGYWLADRRDPLPLSKREWILQQIDENWCSEIAGHYFLEALLLKKDEETWINIYGLWNEGDSHREMSFKINSALVSKSTSQSLLCALAVCKDSYDFKLPEYDEDNFEFDTDDFVLKGWINLGYTDYGIDEHDPHAAKIPYPPYNVGQTIMDRLDLSVDKEQREWYISSRKEPCIICELWSSNKVDRDKDPLMQGQRLNASLSFLKHLCHSFGFDLVIEVQIIKRFKYNSYLRKKDGSENTGTFFKIYILTEDGELRDTEKRYQLR